MTIEAKLETAWNLLVPHCPSIEASIADETVSEIQVMASGQVYVERNGRVKLERSTMPEPERRTFLKHVARFGDREISEENPVIDTRLPDGSRVTGTCPPITTAWTLVIRKFNGHRFTLAELVRIGSVSETEVALLTELVSQQKTIVISGATNTGKTSFLKALAALIPESDRICIVEDSREIVLPGRENIHQFEARPAQGELKAITVRDLVRLCLRYSPARIILGECRGPEAADLIAALSTGHGGSFTTVHAGNATAALTRLARLVNQAALGLSQESIGHDIAAAIQVVVHLEKGTDGTRRVAEVVSVDGYDEKTNNFQCTPLLQAQNDR